MNEPKLPERFLKNHCPNVLEARDWRKLYKVDGDDSDDIAFAECAFHRAGFGMECENCGLFLTRPFCGHKVDEEFLPLIEEYYREMEKYNEYLENKWKEERSGGFIGEHI